MEMERESSGGENKTAASVEEDDLLNHSTKKVKQGRDGFSGDQSGSKSYNDEILWELEGDRDHDFKLQSATTIFATILLLWTIPQPQYGIATDRNGHIFLYFLTM